MSRLHPILLKLCLLSLCCLHVPISLAATESNNTWQADKFDGYVFGSLIGSYHNNGDLTLKRDLTQHDGIEAYRFDAISNSLIGGQITYNFNHQFSATTQMVSRNNVWDNWQPQVVSAFVKYTPNDPLQLRFGRMPINTLIGGDSIYVGYAINNIMPPGELFGFGDRKSYDGMDIDYRWPLAGGIASIRMGYGQSVGLSPATQDGYSDGTDAMFTTLEWQKDTLQIRLGCNRFLTNTDTLDTLSNNLAQIPLGNAQLRAQQINAHKKYANNLFGISAKYEINRWEMLGAFIPFNASAFPESHGKAVMLLLSHNMNQFTPYASFSLIDRQQDGNDLALNLPASFAALNNAYTILANSQNFRQSTLSIGLRYDINEHYDIKLQLDQVRSNNSPILGASSANPKDENMTVFNIGLDFLF
jgi:hypothetical protein